MVALCEVMRVDRDEWISERKTIMLVRELNIVIIETHNNNNNLSPR